MNKKKICVVSAYAYIKEYINYGSLLQYYALEKVLIKMGYNPFWLKYRTNKKQTIKDKVKTIIKIIFNINGEREKKKIINEFSKFIKINLNVSPNEYCSERELENNIPNADYFITGSDQVWAGIDPVNYLCFVPDNKKRISYAASFGKKDISYSHMEVITPWLKKFDNISVREKSGIDICSKMGICAQMAIDPTLLLNEKDYPYLDVHNDRKYKLFYFLNVNEEKDVPREILNEICEEKSEIKIVAGVSRIDEFVKKEYLVYFSPEEWLGAYKNAECIFTNSFHGTVFSLIFHKPFWVFMQNGSSKGQNERMLSLLRMVKLENRIFSNNNIKISDDKIDWKLVDQILDNEKNAAIDYLKKALEYEELYYEN